PSLFQISRGEGQNPGQVAVRLVVHSGETANLGEGLQGITALVGDSPERGRAPARGMSGRVRIRIWAYSARRSYMQGSYPVQFDVDFPARPLDRLTTAFRIFVAIPILIVLGTLSGETLHASSRTATYTLASGGGLPFLPLFLMIVFRQKYPRWRFACNLNLRRFSNRLPTSPPLRAYPSPST